MFRPVIFTWDAKDGVMRVAPRFGNVARAQFTDGEEYPLEVREQRSSKEHAHYFACINEAWQNLEDAETVEQLSTPNKLRQWALIEAGWCDQHAFGPIPYRTALKWAMTAAVFFRQKDDYAEVTVRKTRNDSGKLDGNALVITKTAKSQSRASMAKEDFRVSKRDVLDILSGKICVRRTDLEKAGREAANG